MDSFGFFWFFKAAAGRRHQSINQACTRTHVHQLLLPLSCSDNIIKQGIYYTRVRVNGSYSTSMVARKAILNQEL
jgi:hypothetical protein